MTEQRHRLWGPLLREGGRKKDVSPEPMSQLHSPPTHILHLSFVSLCLCEAALQLLYFAQPPVPTAPPNIQGLPTHA